MNKKSELNIPTIPENIPSTCITFADPELPVLLAAVPEPVVGEFADDLELVDEGIVVALLEVLPEAVVGLLEAVPVAELLDPVRVVDAAASYYMVF